MDKPLRVVMNKLLIVSLVVSLLIAWADLIRNGCNVPSIKRLNFYDSIEILNGTSRTLSCEIHSDTALHKDLPFSGWKRDYPPYLPTNYSLGNASCSVTPSKICIDSNLTLINVIRGEYDGNYSLTVVNDCGSSTVYVYVNIIVLPKCRNDYSRPPPLKIPPPPIVQAVQGMSVIIKATYVGRYDDPNLLTFWCVVKRDGYYHCFFPTDNDPVYNVTINGCLPPNFDCCSFVVSIEIRSSTLDQSEANLTSMAGWSQQDPSFSVGNSTLIINPYPTLDKTLPIASNRSVELTEGQFAKLVCIYNASTNPSVTITTWKFNDELLEQNSSHYTMITEYGNDPTNPNRVMSKLKLSKVIPDNTGTYTCQCAYNSEVVNHKGVTSQANSFYLEVKPQVKSGKKSYTMDEILGGVIGGIIVVGILACIFVVVMLIKVLNKKKSPDRALLDVAGDDNGSTQSTDNHTTVDDPLLFDLARDGSTQLTVDNPPTVDNQTTPLLFNNADNDYGSTQLTDNPTTSKSNVAGNGVKGKAKNATNATITDDGNGDVTATATGTGKVTAEATGSGNVTVTAIATGTGTITAIARHLPPIKSEQPKAESKIKTTASKQPPVKPPTLNRFASHHIIDSEKDGDPSGSDIPTIARFNDYVNEIAPHWYELGAELLDNHTLQVIKANHPNYDVRKCCQEVFNEWIEVDSGASWNTLIDALLKIKLKVVAKKIKKDITKDTLISGQDARSSLKGLIPSHQRPHRQPGDMVTGATNTFGDTTAEIHEHSPAPTENSNHVSTSLESFNKTQSGSNQTDQPAISECCVQDIEESVAEGPQTSIPAAVVCPSEFESRFSFDENLPEPECWRPGPKTYPSQNVKARQVGEVSTTADRWNHTGATNEPGTKVCAAQRLMAMSSSSARPSTFSAMMLHPVPALIKILNLIAPELTNNLNMETLLPFLLLHQLVTRDEEYNLGNPLHPPGKKAQLLLSYLKTKGNDSLQKFLCCLKLAHEHSGHQGVADKLKRLVEANGIKCTDFCSDHCKSYLPS